MWSSGRGGLQSKLKLQSNCIPDRLKFGIICAGSGMFTVRPASHSLTAGRL